MAHLCELAVHRCSLKCSKGSLQPLAMPVWWLPFEKQDIKPDRILLPVLLPAQKMTGSSNDALLLVSCQRGGSTPERIPATPIQEGEG